MMDLLSMVIKEVGNIIFQLSIKTLKIHTRSTLDTVHFYTFNLFI
jgi:hypothetical protein